MMRKLAAAIVAFAMMPVQSAVAVQLVRPDDTRSPYQAWADRSLVPTATGRVTLIRSGCPERPEPACTDGETIWLGEVPGGRGQLRRALLHELGHVFDRRVLSDADRADFERLTGDARSWRDPGPDPPFEQFAVAYSLCARFARMHETQQRGYSYEPTPTDHRRACALIRRAATQF